MIAILSGILFVLMMPVAVSSAETASSGASSHLTPEGAVPIRYFSFEGDEDRDYDRQPDDWVRRRGQDFRNYVISEIDFEQAHQGQRSLRIDANGSNAAYYSQPLPIDSQHSYLIKAAILTRGLNYNAAVVSFSFLNHRKQRIQRVVTSPVSGSHSDWQVMELKPVNPHPDIRFVVVGCHIIPSEYSDFEGSAWFDSIMIGKLPQLNLASNFETHFRQAKSEIAIESYATGLDHSYNGENFDYKLRLQAEDVNGNILEQTVHQLTPTSDEMTDDGRTQWMLPVFPVGYYRVNATLLRNDEEIVRRSTSFAVLNLHGKSSNKGEFGWNLSGPESNIRPEDMLAITQEAGINWVKIPVWERAYSSGSSETGQLLTGVRNQSIVPVGMLVQPPEKIRGKFTEHWTGISELFTSPPIVWREAANQVMALYSPTVTRWQLGDDRDSSFVGLPQFADNMETIREELQRIGQIRQLGARWNVGADVQKNSTIQKNFLTLEFNEETPFDELCASIQLVHDRGFEAWVIVKASKRSEEMTPHARANSLVRRMIDAKRSGADLIFAHDVFDEEYGLLNMDGSPADLFLPWRTVSLALQGSEYAGSIQLPNKSTNHVFLREQDAVIVIWNDQPTEEEIYLGDDVVLHEVWGERTRLMGSSENGRQKIKVTQVPTILTGCSTELARWRMGVSFEKGRIANSASEHEDSLIVTNTFPWNIQGTVKIHSDLGWEISPQQLELAAPKAEQVAIPLSIRLPSQATVGEQTIAMEFDLGGSGLSFPFLVYRDYLVGSGDVHMEVHLSKGPNGTLIVEQHITNETNPPESLDFRCNLLIRGRRRNTRNMTGLLSGQTRKTVYVIPEFETLVSKDLWLRAEQKNGVRTLNEMLTEDQVQMLIDRSEANEEEARFPGLSVR
ncbi:MAG: hypothetical protein KDA78_09910 [Planctomycetaceae bacterium]|nr:hypothetical protein [Planctomycetaceae bacterium]